MFTARELVERLPATLALLRSGEITQRHASDLAEATTSLTPASVAQVEAAVLGRAPEQTVAQFRASVKRAVLRVASPAEEEQAHADAREERRVVRHPGRVRHGRTVGPAPRRGRRRCHGRARRASPTKRSTAKAGTPAPRTSAAPTPSSSWLAPPWPTRTWPKRTGNAPPCRSPSPRPP